MDTLEDQINMKNLFFNITELPSIPNNPASWLSYLNAYIPRFTNHSEEYFAAGKMIPPDKLYSWTKEFLQDAGKCFEKDIVFDEERQKIVASRILAEYIGLMTSEEILNAIMTSEQICATSNLNSYVIFFFLSLFHLFPSVIINSIQ